jgi:hypothetical protein
VNIPQRGRSYILLFIFFQFNFLFICVVSSVANDQLQSQHEYKQQQQHDNTGQNKQKNRHKQRKSTIIQLVKLLFKMLSDWGWIPDKVGIILFALTPDSGRAVAQAVSRWLPTAAARVRVRAACGISGGQSGIGAGFLRVLRFHLPIIPPISSAS